MICGFAAHNRVVNNNNSLSAYICLKGSKSCFEKSFLFIFSRTYGSANVFILNKTCTVRNTRRLSIALCGNNSRIGNAAYHIGINRMFIIKQFTCLKSRIMNTYTVNNTVGTGNINIFKNTHRCIIRLNSRLVTVKTRFINYNHFSGLNITQKFTAKTVNYTALGSNNIAVVKFSDAKRTEAVFITKADKS